MTTEKINNDKVEAVALAKLLGEVLERTSEPYLLVQDTAGGVVLVCKDAPSTLDGGAHALIRALEFMGARRVVTSSRKGEMVIAARSVDEVLKAVQDIIGAPEAGDA